MRDCGVWRLWPDKRRDPSSELNVLFVFVGICGVLTENAATQPISRPESEPAGRQVSSDTHTTSCSEPPPPRCYRWESFFLLCTVSYNYFKTPDVTSGCAVSLQALISWFRSHLIRLPHPFTSPCFMMSDPVCYILWFWLQEHFIQCSLYLKSFVHAFQPFQDTCRGLGLIYVQGVFMWKDGAAKSLRSGIHLRLCVPPTCQILAFPFPAAVQASCPHPHIQTEKHPFSFLFCYVPVG